MLKDVESVTLFKWEAKTYPFNYSLELKRKKKKRKKIVAANHENV